MDETTTYHNQMNNDANDYILKDHKLCFSHSFDKPLKPYHNIMRQVDHLVFGNNFNQILKITPNIIHLILGNNFNRIFKISPHIETLEFGNNFNQPVILTQCLKILIFGDNFNQPIVLTPGIQKLRFGCNFNHPIVLTPNISHLTFGKYFNQDIDLTPGLKYVQFGESYSYTIFECPKNVETYEFSNKDGDYLVAIPKNILRLTIEMSSEEQIGFNKKMKYFCLNSTFANTIFPNKNMLHFSVKYSYSHPNRGKSTIFVLSKKITHLHIDVCTSCIQLPKHLTHLTLGLGKTRQNMALSNLLQLKLNYVVFFKHNIQLEQMGTDAEITIICGEHKIIDNIPNGANSLNLRFVSSLDNTPSNIKNKSFTKCITLNKFL